jgi:hypothetical protein
MMDKAIQAERQLQLLCIGVAYLCVFQFCGDASHVAFFFFFSLLLLSREKERFCTD